MRVALVLVCAALVAFPAAADIDDDTYSSKQWKIQLVAPRYWQLTEQTSYPNILLWMSRRSPDGKMLLSAERLESGTDAKTYATTTRALLTKSGFRARAPQFHSATGAYWMDFDNGKSFLRQAFIVRETTVYILTLASSNSRTRNQHLRAFDVSLRSIRLLRDEEVPADASPEVTGDNQPTAEDQEINAPDGAGAPAPEPRPEPVQP